MTDHPQPVPPGWYPESDEQLRYWDGLAWTDQRAPAPPLTDTPAPPSPLPHGASSMASAEGTPTSDERTTAALAHALAIVSSILAPLIIWAINRDESPFVRAHAAEALNFSISALIYGFVYFVVAVPLIFVGIGILMLFSLPFLGLAVLVLHVLAATAAYRGEMYRYPFSIRLIK